jgi:tripartite-type tricarboxylate transporter receptor subunit TctC
MLHVKQANARTGTHQAGADKEGKRMHYGTIRALTLAMAAALLAAVPAPASAQVSDQTIKIIFPFAAGGSGDALARLIAEHLRTALDRPVIVESRTGAQGRIGVQAVKAAAPDGNTILLTPVAPMSVYQHVYKGLAYDPIADFVPVSQAATFDFAVAVAPQVPAASLKELVAWVKTNPDKGTYGSPGAGALPHFLGVSFAKAAGIDLRHLGYRGSAAAMIDLVGGQIPIVFTTTADVLEHHKAGRIKVLATSAGARSPFLPEVPTLKEAGFNLVASGWYGVFAPAGTPEAVVARLSAGVAGAVQSPPIKTRLLALGLVPTGTSAAELGRIQKADSDLWAPAVKASGFTPQQ